MNTANVVVTRQSIRFKLMLSFALMVALLLGVMAAGWLALDYARSQAEKIAANQHVPQIKRLTDVELLMVKISLEARHAMLAVNDPPELQATLQRIGENRQRLVALLDEIEARLATERGRDNLRKIRQADADFWRLGQQTVGLIQAGNTAAAFALLKNELVPARNRQLDLVGEQLAWQHQLMDKELVDLSRTIVQIQTALAVVVAVVLLLLGVFVVRLIGSIARRLARLQDVIVRVEQSGDLTLHVGAAGQDEVGQAAAAFDRMIAKIAALIGDTRQSAETIAAAAQSMSAAGAQVEKGSGAQAEATAAVAAAVEQTSVSISETAGNAQSADETAARARADIEKTLAAVRATAADVDKLAGMIDAASGDIGRLAESSRQIDGIVQTIKDIADQTNLLALNAAIEAARAGEQGRGFAVVADEVRKLAERTANSTSEISTLIGGIQSEVDGAVARMQQANDTAGATRERVIASTGALDAASADTGRVTESVRSIADAVREQDAAVQQVAQRIEQIAQMTETNTAAARSAADTARHLDALAGKLREAVGRFRV
jgi:methyl-accepting chemotaxis protein